MPRKRRGRYKQQLTVPMILAWADAYHRKHGTWPHSKAGLIEGTGNETWRGVDFALTEGNRGLRTRISLVALLRQNRGIYSGREALNEKMIFKWAKAQYQRTGRWPKYDDRMVVEAPVSTWNAVNDALIIGRRGLPPGSSLEELLLKHGVSPEIYKQRRPYTRRRPSKRPRPGKNRRTSQRRSRG